MNILFYSQFDQRSRDTESLMLAFRNQGHNVISLTQAKGTYIHAYLNTVGIEGVSYELPKTNQFVFFLKHINFLIRFCKARNIQIIYSHLEAANFTASIAQFFIKARVYICRHHIDEAALQGFDNSILYKLTYLLARNIIVVSNRAAEYMVEIEKIKPYKIKKINLAYDFSLYANPDVAQVDYIKKQISADLILITICRLTKYKRAGLSILVLKSLINNGINAKLIVLGKVKKKSI